MNISNINDLSYIKNKKMNINNIINLCYIKIKKWILVIQRFMKYKNKKWI